MDIVSDGSTLVLRGDFDVRSTSEVRNAVYDLLDRHDGHVTIDITQVDTVDVTALKVLAVASRFAHRDGRRIVLRGACPAVRRMLHLSHLIRFVELEREAIPA
ncbi:STAS domain-containing protein [Nocardioides sp. TF02-7]|uniref:STAS domain-containing protein n=1 Tax=Nocardioides sp. TF02-7 TaxID=2917724 RepID=UPI001F070AB1|nr:STAS domain-containing protein [Nocardioides sp. TF02-7]UMG91992.1 STAS domain-containing protein [Nocardioides sp. TF02-7]